MERVVTIDPESLRQALRLTPQDRLRQANAAWRLYHALHQPYARPWTSREGEDRVAPPVGRSALRG